MRIQTSLDRLLGRGGELAEAHAVTTTAFLASLQASLSVLQQIIAGALLLMLVFVFAAARGAYGGLIAPLQARLVKLRAIAERQEKLVAPGSLSAGVAHEIRNPLTAIRARLFTQRKGLAEGSAEWQANEFIGEEISRLERIVREFLLFAKPPEPEMRQVSLTGPVAWRRPS